MKTILLLWLLLALIAGCSQTEQLTSTRLSLLTSDSVEGGTLSGGYSLIAKNPTTGEVFVKAIRDAALDLQFDLTNGKWDFFVTGWMGAALTSPTKCGFIKGVNLEGFPIDLRIVINDFNCADQFFTTKPLKAATPVKFSEISFNSCFKFIDAAGGPVTYSNHCGASENGVARSYQVMLKSFKVQKGIRTEEDETIESVCLKNINTGDAKLHTTLGNYPYLTELNIPDQQDFHIVVKAFDLDRCAGNFEEYDFANGLANGIDGDNSANPKALLLSSLSNYRLFLKSDVSLFCERSRDIRPFASSGTGGSTGSSESDRHLICNHHQLNQIGGANFAANLNKRYKIIREINYFEDFEDGSYDEALFVGLNPIGQSIDAYPFDSTEFTGVLDGGGNYIKAMELDGKDITPSKFSYIGLVRKLGTAGVVKNLKLLLPRLDFSDHNGKIVDNIGFIAGQSKGKIENVFVEHGQISGSTRVGGLVGTQIGGQIVKSQALEIGINGFAQIGGIVGEALSIGASGINQVKSTGRIQTEDGPKCLSNITNDADCITAGYEWFEDVGLCYKTQASVQADCGAGGLTWLVPKQIGGIVGKMSGCVNSSGHIQQSVSSVTILGYTVIGGIAGESASCIIDNSYSTSTLITKYITDSQVGGVVGINNPGATIIRSFHTEGSIKGAATIDGVANGGGTCTNSYGSSFTTSCSGGGLTYETIRDDVSFVGFNMSPAIGNNTSTIWKLEDVVDYPRLAWESPRACQGKWNTTFAGGSGTVSDPYLVCSRTQFININTQAVKHFKLMNNIDLLGANNQQVIPNSIMGSVDGNNMRITNFSPLVVGDNVGIFHDVGRTGVIKNLNILAPKIDATGRFNIGALTSENRGLIENISVLGGLIQSGTYTGLIAGRNFVEDYSGVKYYGRIRNVEIAGEIIYGTTSGLVVGENNSIVEFAKVKGSMSGVSKIGGIAGGNGGVIYASSSDADISPVVNNATMLGGIAGENIHLGIPFTITKYSQVNGYYPNGGAIVEALFEGTFDLDGYSNTNRVGGIAGSGSSLSIIDDSMAMFWLFDNSFDAGNKPTTNLVGGIVGDNSGKINRSISDFSYNLNASATDLNTKDWGPIVGAGSAPDITQSFTLHLLIEPGANALGTVISEADAQNVNTFVTAGWNIEDGESYDEENPSVWLHYGDWLPRPSSVERKLGEGRLTRELWMELMGYTI